MKKIFALIMALALVFCMTGCTDTKNDNTTTPGGNVTDSPSPENDAVQDDAEDDLTDNPIIDNDANDNATDNGVKNDAANNAPANNTTGSADGAVAP